MTPRWMANESGADIVLIHGWGANAAVWDDVAARLAPHARVRCIDLPGYGGSPTCAPYTLDALSDALARGLPARATVCGWSLGGLVALNCALREPQRIKSLVLIATTPRFTRIAGWDCAVDAALLDGFADELQRDRRATLRRFAALQAHGDTDARAVSRRLRVQIEAGGTPDLAVLRAGLSILKGVDLRERLPHLELPALILHGERDSVVPLAAAEFAQRALPQARLEVLAGAAHAPFVTRATRVAQRITELCNER